MTTQSIPPLMPDGLEDYSDETKARHVQSGRAAVGVAIRRLEQAVQHIAAARQVQCSCLAHPVDVSYGSPKTFKLRIPTAPFQAKARIAVALAGSSNNAKATVSAVSAYASGDTKTESVPQLPYGLAYGTTEEPAWVELEVEIGDGSAMDIGTQPYTEIDVTITSTVTPRVVYCYGLSVTVLPCVLPWLEEVTL